MTTIGDNVRKLRKMRGLTQTELAQRAEITQYAVSGIETGAHRPQARTTRRLAAALDVRVSDLYEGVEEAPKAQAPRPSKKTVQGRELLERIRANLRLLEHYMEHPVDEDTWDQALNEHFALSGEGTAWAIRELRQHKVAQRPYQNVDLIADLIRADQAAAEARPRFAEFNLAQYGHRHRDAG